MNHDLGICCVRRLEFEDVQKLAVKHTTLVKMRPWTTLLSLDRLRVRPTDGELENRPYKYRRPASWYAALLVEDGSGPDTARHTDVAQYLQLIR